MVKEADSYIDEVNKLVTNIDDGVLMTPDEIHKLVLKGVGIRRKIRNDKSLGDTSILINNRLATSIAKLNMLKRRNNG